MIVEQPRKKKKKKSGEAAKIKREERKKKRRETGEKEEGRQAYLKQPLRDKEQESSTILPADQQTRANSRLPPPALSSIFFFHMHSGTAGKIECAAPACIAPASLAVHGSLLLSPSHPLPLPRVVARGPEADTAVALIQPPGHVPPRTPHSLVPSTWFNCGEARSDWPAPCIMGPGRSRAPAPASGFRIGASVGVSLNPHQVLLDPCGQ